MNQFAFQDEIPSNYCWGCGSTNSHGLQMKSRWSGDEAVCTWHPKEYHVGPKHFLNGGIIATIIDCHCIWTATAGAYRAEGRKMYSQPSIWYVTASMKVSYLHPTPVNRPVVLHAQIQEMNPKKTILTCSLFSEEEECARGEVVAIRVPPEWPEEHGLRMQVQNFNGSRKASTEVAEVEKGKRRASDHQGS